MNPNRHERDCRICRHEHREEIEHAFIDWASPAKISSTFGLRSRNSIYRHARAFGLFEKRERNIRSALGKIIEKVSTVHVTGQTIVAAIVALSKLNSAGQWVDRTRSEHVDLNYLFDKMSRGELERYAQTGELPAWFAETVRGADHPAEKPRGAE
jgi:hypothetical protein